MEIFYGDAGQLYDKHADQDIEFRDLIVLQIGKLKLRKTKLFFETNQ